MSTLARLRGETERIRSGRRVFVSSAPVLAYKVAQNKKHLLEGQHPLVLALAEDDFSMVDASVGDDLKWTLTSINHVMRTVSKYGEPTYLFANILDTDPEAFVAVTLHKRTPGEELEHLEGVISRVCNFHVAESKPMQVPGPDLVLGALGKGLAKLVFGGSSSSKGKDQHKQRNSRSPSPSRNTTQQQQQQPEYSWLTPAERERAEQARSEKERFNYLSSLEARRGTHVASATGTAGYGGYRPSRAEEEEGEDVPTAPKMPSSRTGMGVGSKAEADARLAALKAEMRGEGGAPGVSASYRDTRPGQQQSGGGAYPSIPTDNTRTPPADWQRHQAGTLSNPFTGGGGNNGNNSGRDAPHTMSYEDYLGRDELWGGANRHDRSSAPQAPSAGGGFYESGVEYTQSGDPVLRSRQQQQYGQQGQYGQQYGQRGSAAAYGDDSDRGSYGEGYMGYSLDRDTAAAHHSQHQQQQQQLSDREQRRLQYEREAREAREEWDRAQREQAHRRSAAESAPAGPAVAPAGSATATKPRVRYHEVKYDNTPYDDSTSAGGWGEGAGRGQQPAYAGAGGGGWGGAEQQGGGNGGGSKKKGGPPGWLEMLGKVYAGGPDL